VAAVAELEPLQISAALWQTITAELAVRGRGSRESGAFLLAKPGPEARRVSEFIPFDDLDPKALNGAIAIDAPAFSKLWRICRERQLTVVGDMHTHPGAIVRQSVTDQRNPMVARAGHVAVILPNYAQRNPHREQSGVHVYRGEHTWVSRYGREAAALLAGG
jgi:proteasome lid subunit RPN8/RPN11